MPNTHLSTKPGQVQVAGCGLGSGRPLQNCLCDLRNVCQREDAVWAELKPWRQLARASRTARLWVSDRTGISARRRKRWINLECSADALRKTDTAGRGHFGGHWRADHHRRHGWLHLGGMAFYAGAAAAIAWLRIFDRFGARGPTVEHDCTVWRTDGAPAVEAAA